MRILPGKSVGEVMQEQGIQQVDESELVNPCQTLIEANPKLIDEIKSGKLQAAGAFVGQAKKKNPNVNPNRVRELCLELAQKA